MKVARKQNKIRKALNPFLKRMRAMPRLEEIDYRYKAVSLFCGGGGLDLGAAWAGFDPVFASDIEPAHCETVAQNFAGCSTLPIDVQELTGDTIREMTATTRFDLLAGGPPCQAFSILGRRNSFQDPRGRLVYEYCRLIVELQPRAFVFENVPGLLTLHQGNDWRDLLTYYRQETGYKLFTARLNAADFGIPQIRKRVFLVGFKDASADFSFPVPTHENPSQDSQREIEGFLEKREAWVPAKHALESLNGALNHRIRPHGDRVRNRYAEIPPGGRDRIDHTDRIDPDKPSGTVIVGSRAGGGRPHIHPVVPRHISVREAARLQSFPDWYEFASTETWQYRAVGNAVPPLLGFAVCASIAKTLDELTHSRLKTKL